MIPNSGAATSAPNNDVVLSHEELVQKLKEAKGQPGYQTLLKELREKHDAEAVNRARAEVNAEIQAELEPEALLLAEIPKLADELGIGVEEAMIEYNRLNALDIKLTPEEEKNRIALDAFALEVIHDRRINLTREIARRKLPLEADDGRAMVVLDLPEVGRFHVGNFTRECLESRQMQEWLRQIQAQILDIHAGEHIVDARFDIKTCADLFDYAVLTAPSRLPEIETPQNFLAARMELDPFIIDGLLHQNSKMNMTGQSKARKTWLMLQQALCIGSGRPWLGHETVKSPVLFVNLELKKNTMNNRIYDVCEAMGIDPVKGHLVDSGTSAVTLPTSR